MPMRGGLPRQRKASATAAAAAAAAQEAQEAASTTVRDVTGSPCARSTWSLDSLGWKCIVTGHE
jgi:hypothetical protein